MNGVCRGFIFDQDGLLFDTESVYAKAWTGVSEEYGYGFTDAMTRKISGYGRGEVGAQIAKLIDIDDVERFVDLVMDRARELLLAAPPVLKPGVRELLELARERGIKTAIASSAPRYCIDWNLSSTGLRPYFDVVVAGEDVRLGKPNPDIFLRACSLLGLQPSECTVFEDAFSGIQAAVAAGCRAILVPDRRPADGKIAEICTVYRSLTDFRLDFSR